MPNSDDRNKTQKCLYVYGYFNRAWTSTVWVWKGQWLLCMQGTGYHIKRAGTWENIQVSARVGWRQKWRGRTFRKQMTWPREKVPSRSGHDLAMGREHGWGSKRRLEDGGSAVMGPEHPAQGGRCFRQSDKIRCLEIQYSVSVLKILHIVYFKRVTKARSIHPDTQDKGIQCLTPRVH